MRFLVLAKQLAGHTAACYQALAAAGADLQLIHRAATPNAPFDDTALTAGLDSWAWTDTVDDGPIQVAVDEFRPDVLLVWSWDVGAYRRVARRSAGGPLRVLLMDNPWLGTPKQWAGRVISRVAIRPCYDVAFLPGERQAAFARRLGFGEDQLLWGLYSCDTNLFSVPGAPDRHGFLYVGRLVEDKGVDVLLAAYRRHRQSSASPWPLRMAGTGPMAATLAGEDGVELLGFVAPPDLPAHLASAGCLVLPSRFEPWGVVVHEAAAAGLPVICTTACGASTRLVLDGYNGRVVPADDAVALAVALDGMGALAPERRADLGDASRRLARQLTPERWASYLLERAPELIARHCRS